MAPRGFDWNSNDLEWMKTLPAKIRCGVCNILKKNDQFSKKQLRDYDRNSRNSERLKKDLIVKCCNCTGVQVQELTCILCDEVKGLDEFARAQRRDPDMAKCMLCMEKQLDLQPEDTASHDSDASSESNQYLQDDHSTSDRSMALRALSLSEQSQPGSSTNQGSTNARGMWVEQPRRGFNMSRGTRSICTAPSFNPSAYGCPSSPATAASVVGVRSEELTSRNAPSGGWAKIKATAVRADTENMTADDPMETTPAKDEGWSRPPAESDSDSDDY